MQADNEAEVVRAVEVSNKSSESGICRLSRSRTRVLAGTSIVSMLSIWGVDLAGTWMPAQGE